MADLEEFVTNKPIIVSLSVYTMINYTQSDHCEVIQAMVRYPPLNMHRGIAPKAKETELRQATAMVLCCLKDLKLRILASSGIHEGAWSDRS